MAQSSDVKKLTNEQSQESLKGSYTALATTDATSIALPLDVPSKKIATAESMTTKTKTTKHSATNISKCCITSGSFILGFCAIMVKVILYLALPGVVIFMGYKYANQCPINPRIPQFLIVLGAMNIVSNIVTLLKKGSEKEGSDKYKMCCSCLLLPIQIILFTWIIFGSVWTFSVKSTVQYDDPTNLTTYCHKTLYLFTFIILIFNYVFLALLCCLAFSCCSLLAIAGSS